MKDIFKFSQNESSKLSKKQQKNIKNVLELSKRFHEKAHIISGKQYCTEESIILESGHQPNFLPYLGIFRKAYLLNYIVKKNEKTEEVIPLFGFADQNLSTAPLLYSNHVVSNNKEGFLKIGFKIQNQDKYRCFNCIPKPSEEKWEKEINSIVNVFKNNLSNYTIKEQLSFLIEILHKSYEYSNNFAELNAICFSKICSDFFNLKLNFLLYSDVQRSKIFLDEWKFIFKNLDAYNDVYNTTITKKNLPITPLTRNHLPFWYHCDCGGKVSLHLRNTYAFGGQCPLCGNSFNLDLGFDFERLQHLMPCMGTTAVSRNLIFSNGLGTRLFVSGSGGSQYYNQISDEIARKLHLIIPHTLIWFSKEDYIGTIHYQTLRGLKKACNLSDIDIYQQNLNENINKYHDELIKEIQSSSDIKKQKYLKGRLINIHTQLLLTKNVYNTIPSIIDILLNIEKNVILSSWEHSIKGTCPMLDKDIIRLYTEHSYSNSSLNYNEEQIRCIINNIKCLELKNEKNPDY